MDGVPEAPDLRQRYGSLAGIEFQRAMERRAAVAGGGGLRAPVHHQCQFGSASMGWSRCVGKDAPDWAETARQAT